MEQAFRSGGPGDRLRRYSRPATRAGRSELVRLTRAHLESLNGWTIALVAALYFGSALVGNALRLTGNVDAVWPPAGVGIAALYLGGLRLLPGVFFGDVLADLPNHLPLSSSIGQTAGNMLEVTVAALLLRRLTPQGSPLDRVNGLSRLLVAVLAGTAISATAGSLSLFGGDVIEAHEIPTLWRTWFLGDSCGALIVVPLAIAWLHLQRPLFEGRRIELSVLLAITAGLTVLGLEIQGNGPLMYLVFPGLIAIALRFGARGATLAVALTATITIWVTGHAKGAFVVHSITNEVLSIQLYLAAAIISSLVLAAIVSEREQYAARLAASRSRIVDAGDAERRRLERDLHDGAQQRLSALSARVDDLQSQQRSADETDALLRHVNAELSSAIGELRELAHGIHPAILTDFGLRRAIESMAARANVPVRLAIELPARRLDESVESSAYYVIAESLTNAERYSRCTAIDVRLRVVQDALEISVADDGVGGARSAPGSGLEGLYDRVESVGGTFRVISLAGGGTEVLASIPLGSPVD